MTRLLFRQTILFFAVSLYLFGGHAMAHGLSWCLGIEGHGHIDQASDCATAQLALPGFATTGCKLTGEEPDSSHHQKTECRHLPVSHFHILGKVERNKSTSGGAEPVVAAAYSFTSQRSPLSHLQEAIPVVTKLPPPVALSALRTIILLC